MSQEIGHEKATRGRPRVAGQGYVLPVRLLGASYYLWRNKLGGMTVSDAKR